MVHSRIALVAALVLVPASSLACDYQAQLDSFISLLKEQGRARTEFNKHKRTCLTKDERKAFDVDYDKEGDKREAAWKQAQAAESSGDMKTACDAIAQAQLIGGAQLVQLTIAIDKCTAK